MLTKFIFFLSISRLYHWEDQQEEEYIFVVASHAYQNLFIQVLHTFMLHDLLYTCNVEREY